MNFRTRKVYKVLVLTTFICVALVIKASCGPLWNNYEGSTYDVDWDNNWQKNDNTSDLEGNK